MVIAGHCRVHRDQPQAAHRRDAVLRVVPVHPEERLRQRAPLIVVAPGQHELTAEALDDGARDVEEQLVGGWLPAVGKVSRDDQGVDRLS